MAKTPHTLKVGIISLNISHAAAKRVDSGREIFGVAFCCRNWIMQSNVVGGYDLGDVFRVKEAKSYEERIHIGIIALIPCKIILDCFTKKVCE